MHDSQEMITFKVENYFIVDKAEPNRQIDITVDIKVIISSVRIIFIINILERINKPRYEWPPIIMAVLFGVSCTVQDQF